MTNGPAWGHFRAGFATHRNERSARAFVGGTTVLRTKATMTDKITLGGIGYLLAGVTVFVTLMGAMVVMDYTSGRMDLDGTMKSATTLRR